jgi:hypothetical protein
MMIERAPFCIGKSKESFLGVLVGLRLYVGVGLERSNVDSSPLQVNRLGLLKLTLVVHKIECSMNARFADFLEYL